MNNQFPYIISLYGFFGILTMVFLLAIFQLRNFLKTHDSINTEAEFAEFKRVIKKDMILAIIMVIFSILFLGSAIAGLYQEAYTWPELQKILFYTSSIATLTGIILKPLEKQMKTIPLNNEAFRQEFEHIIKKWGPSLFPDW